MLNIFRFLLKYYSHKNVSSILQTYNYTVNLRFVEINFVSLTLTSIKINWTCDQTLNVSTLFVFLQDF